MGLSPRTSQAIAWLASSRRLLRRNDGPRLSPGKRSDHWRSGSFTRSRAGMTNWCHSLSLGLFEVDQDRVGGEEGNHDRQEINDVAQIDDAPRDRAEMAEKA